MTEPEQWAVELWTEARRRHDVAKRSPGFYNQEPELIAALTIQRALEERERKLRDVCDGIDADYMTSEKHHPGYVLIPTATFQAIIASRQALKDTTHD